MLNLNRLTIAGNLTRDVELTYTTKGTAVGQSSVAINRKWATDSGEKKEEVTFVEFKCFGRTAENAAKMTGKGLNILIEGRLSLEQWTDKATGKPRQKLAVIADMVHFIQFKDDGERSFRPSVPKPSRQPEPQDAGGHGAGEDSDIPF